ncbi:SDR family oxidoreductase [Mesorhizobium sp. M0960]|uniref:SDR family oxidoreductase n=1 Tax=Mesorhizobium sp. M0960 TaxID=2957035 RepID=UPI00333CE79B
MAFTGGFAHVGYTASRGGVRSLTHIMCREHAPNLIRVNAVAPGYIDIAMAESGTARRMSNCWHCPMRRFGQAREIAEPVVFLASKVAPLMGYPSRLMAPISRLGAQQKVFRRKRTSTQAFNR